MPEHAQSKLLQRGEAWKSHSGAKRHHFDPVPYSARACDDVFTHEVSRAFHSAAESDCCAALKSSSTTGFLAVKTIDWVIFESNQAMEHFCPYDIIRCLQYSRMEFLVFGVDIAYRS